MNHPRFASSFTTALAAIPRLSGWGAAGLAGSLLVSALLLVASPSAGLELLPILLVGFVPACRLMAAGDDDEVDEGAKTIVSMPAWMIEEIEKKTGSQVKKGDYTIPRKPVAPPPQVPVVEDLMASPGQAEEEDLGTAKTVMFSPSQTAQFAAAGAGPASRGPETAPPPEPGPPPESGSGTMMFDPSQMPGYKSFRASRPAPPAEPPEEEVSRGSGTLMFDPSQAAGIRSQILGARQQETHPPEVSEEEPRGSGTLMFEASAAERVRSEILKKREAPPAEEVDDVGQTMTYSPADLKRIRELAKSGPDATEELAAAPEMGSEPDGEARTVAFMPAVGQPPAEAEPQDGNKPEGDAYAPTQMYMPAVGTEGGAETVAYTPEDRAKLLEQMRRGDGERSTNLYQAAPGGALDEAYKLLEQSKKPAEKTEAQKQAQELLAASRQKSQVHLPPQVAKAIAQKTPTEPKAKAVPAQAPTEPKPKAAAGKTATQPKAKAAPASVPAPAPDVKKGLGTIPLVIILLLLLAMAGAATVLILHFIGVVDLPIEGLPQLELFKNG
jgi:hypothetical protein